MFQHSSELAQQLQAAYEKKGADYEPRTRYLDEQQQPLYINRLILEDSPYLLQHAHNPVDWFPWGEHAFAEAKQKNKPVFLSIGYSTCHWCHVMEEQSFDNEEVAQVMNDYFICIKVDREIHPDVDTYYMAAVMMMQGQGGWPMSSFLTPERKPFFGGTYFQPAQFVSLMQRVNEVWHNQHNDILEQADSFSKQVAGAMAARQSLNEIGINVIDLTAQALMNHYDPAHGGFGQAPKFPNEPYLYFLLDYAIFKEDRMVLDAMTSTLHIQSCGGIYDQIGGGFHRYATDSNWLIPHFEKMLYNQANLSYLFAQAWLLTRARDFKRVAQEMLDYVLREMTNSDGGFYSATDADSEGEEGLFFIWDKDEIEQLLGDDATEFIELYQITGRGNFEGKNIPNLAMPLERYSKEQNIDYDELIKRLARYKQTLLGARNKRIPPLRDDKVITAWNGMMIKAFAYAGELFDQQNYIDAATNAADYVLQHNRTGHGSLSRSSLNGNASIPALQEDYAYLAEALLQLYDTTHDRHWLQQAQQLTHEMIERFWDEESGGFFMAETNTGGLLPFPPKEVNDNATASGNSVALKLLSRLYRRAGLQKYDTYAKQLIRAYSDDITQRPYISSYMMDGLLELLAGEQSNRQFCSDGNVCIEAAVTGLESGYSVTLSVQLNDGWYLNQFPDTGKPVPIHIETIGQQKISDASYPQAVTKQLDYQKEPAKVYTDSFEITLKIAAKDLTEIQFPGSLVKLKISLQACNQEKCLAQEDVQLVIFL